MLLSAVSVLVAAQSSSEIPEGLMNNPVLKAGNWPVSKNELTNRNMKQFLRYINSMDLEKTRKSF